MKFKILLLLNLCNLNYPPCNNLISMGESLVVMFYNQYFTSTRGNAKCFVEDISKNLELLKSFFKILKADKFMCLMFCFMMSNG